MYYWLTFLLNAFSATPWLCPQQKSSAIRFSFWSCRGLSSFTSFSLPTTTPTWSRRAVSWCRKCQSARVLGVYSSATSRPFSTASPSFSASSFGLLPSFSSSTTATGNTTWRGVCKGPKGRGISKCPKFFSQQPEVRTVEHFSVYIFDLCNLIYFCFAFTVMEVSLESSFQPTIQLYIIFPTLLREMTRNKEYTLQLFTVCTNDKDGSPVFKMKMDQNISIITVRTDDGSGFFYKWLMIGLDWIWI